jgi:hypothetical protein
VFLSVPWLYLSSCLTVRSDANLACCARRQVTDTMVGQSSRFFVLRLAVVLLTFNCIYGVEANLIDASNSLHPLSVSIQLPQSSQLLFYSMTLASALAPGESASAAISRSAAHASLSTPVVLCSSSISGSEFDSSNSIHGASVTSTTCVFRSHLTAPLESLLLRSPAPSNLILHPPSFIACVRAFSAIANISADAQRCSSVTCSSELQMLSSSHNLTATRIDLCETLVISPPPLVLAASFGAQTIAMPSLVPTGSDAPILTATFTAAAAAGADLKLLLLVSSQASDFALTPANQPPPPCRYSTSVEFAFHSNIIVANSSTWLSPSFSTPRAPAALYSASSPFAALLLSSPLVSKLAVVTFTIKPCLIAPVFNQSFCVVPHVTQPAAAAPVASSRDARFAYAFSERSNVSLMTVSTPFVCVAYSLPLPLPRWLSAGPDMLRAQPRAASVFQPSQFPTALQQRAAVAAVEAAAAQAVALRTRIECTVWHTLLSQGIAAPADAYSGSESACPVVPPHMLPGLQLMPTAAGCQLAIPFTATSGTSGFDVNISFLRSPSAQRFSFRTLTGSEVEDGYSQFSVTGERVEVQAQVTLSQRDVGAVIPLCAVMWAAAASASVDESVFDAKSTRVHCVAVLAQPCMVCGRRSISYTAMTMSPPVSPQLLMALNLNTVRSLPPPPPGFSVSPPARFRSQQASPLLPELQRSHASSMQDGHLLQTGIAHTIGFRDTLAAVAARLRSSLPLLAAWNPGLPMNASEAGAGGADHELVEGAVLCVQPVSSGEGAAP